MCRSISLLQNLSAFKFTFLYNEEFITLVAFLNNIISSSFVNFLDSAYDNFHFLRVKRREHESLLKTFSNSSVIFFRFLVERSLEVFLLVETSKSFSTDRLTCFVVVSKGGFNVGLEFTDLFFITVVASTSISTGFGVFRAFVFLLRSLSLGLICEIFYFFAEIIKLNAFIGVDTQSFSVVLTHVV